MIGIAKMAWKLADARAFPETEPSLPIQALGTREEAERLGLPATTEYYRIIDRLSAGEKP
jgi:hypothetical protein